MLCCCLNLLSLSLTFLDIVFWGEWLLWGGSGVINYDIESPVKNALDFRFQTHAAHLNVSTLNFSLKSCMFLFIVLKVPWPSLWPCPRFGTTGGPVLHRDAFGFFTSL